METFQGRSFVVVGIALVGLNAKCLLCHSIFRFIIEIISIVCWNSGSLHNQLWLQTNILFIVKLKIGLTWIIRGHLLALWLLLFDRVLGDMLEDCLAVVRFTTLSTVVEGDILLLFSPWRGFYGYFDAVVWLLNLNLRILCISLTLSISERDMELLGQVILLI